MRKAVLAFQFALGVTVLFNAPASADCRGSENRLKVVGLTSDQRLVCFNADRPSSVDNLGEISGLSGDTRLVGIDFRPATGELYGIGDDGGIYVLDTDDASATLRGQLNTGLSGSDFGVDFNPTVDRLRIISNTGQNLRVDVSTGAVTADTNLAVPGATAPSTGVTAAAYTNNDSDANTGTLLFNIDTTNDQLVIQAPPNAGSINAVGKLRVDASSAAGFDIYTTVRGGGSSVNAQGFAVLTSGGRARFYRINLLSGRAWMVGPFRNQDQVIDIAVPLRQRGGS